MNTVSKLLTLSAAMLLSTAGFAQKEHQDVDYSKFMTTPNGLKYSIIKHGQGGPKAEIGSQITLNMHIYLHDSLVFDTRKVNNDQPVPTQVMPPIFKGDIAEGFTYLSAGDSAIFMLPSDTLIKAGQKAPGLQPGDTILYEVSLVTVKPAAEVRKEAEAKRQASEAAAKTQNATDDKILKEYFAKNKIKATKTASGIYYKVTKIGLGPEPKPGQKVTVNYTGKLLDGTIFDSNIDPSSTHKEPLSFVIGHHQVIRGWDEGIALLQKGEKATLYIPSSMAYGPNSPSPKIPANSILVFDVELLDISNAQ